MTSARICSSCGAELPKSKARFCNQCGASLGQSHVAPVGGTLPRQRNHLVLWLASLALLLLAGGLAVLEPVRVVLLNAVGVTSVNATPAPSAAVAVHAEDAVAAPVPSKGSPSAASDRRAPAMTAPSVPPTSSPTATLLPTATTAPTSTPTPAPALQPLARVRGTVNLRTGPGTNFDILDRLSDGAFLQVLGRNLNGDWLNIQAPNGLNGWMARQFLDVTGLDLATLPVVSTPSQPACQIVVDNNLRGGFQRDQLGCPIAGAHTTWAAWASFEHGAMLWRDDTNQVTVLYDGGGWATLPDQWHGEDPPSRGLPPAGLHHPIRGFGWIWGNQDEVYNGIGWATGEEKGVCLLVQDFEQGFLFTKSSQAFCPDRGGQSQFSRAAELPSLSITLYAQGAAWRRY